MSNKASYREQNKLRFSKEHSKAPVAVPPLPLVAPLLQRLYAEKINKIVIFRFDSPSYCRRKNDSARTRDRIANSPPVLNVIILSEIRRQRANGIFAYQNKGDVQSQTRYAIQALVQT